mgnify:FL=1
MKPQLTLKHLAPYLPYGLKCKWNQSNPFILVGLQKGNESVNNDLWTWKDGSRYLTGYLYECKPILRPLSDYTDITSKAMSDLNCDLTNQMDIQEFALKKMSLSSLLYSSFEVLTRNHVDIFGLIPEGLAIDINTL